MDARHTTMVQRFARWARVLTFRATTEDYQDLDRTDFLLGMAATWVVGMGRYWDDPRATWLQKLGTGSVVYIFVLSALLWLLAKPLSPSTVRAGRTAVFVSLTSAPAILYAIPVEMWVPLPTANQINLWFLAAVALWHLLLLFRYFRFGCSVARHLALLCTLTPVAGIAAVLVSLNVHHVVFEIMGGLRESDRSAQDAAYGMLMLITVISFPVSVACGGTWLALVVANGWKAWRR